MIKARLYIKCVRVLFTQDIRGSFKHTCNTTVSLEIMKNVMRATYTHFAL